MDTRLKEIAEWYRKKTEERDLYASPIADALAGINQVGELLTMVGQLRAQVDAIKPIADYASYQADMAQSRWLKQENLYDDTYWQSVLDTIRFELLQIAAIKGEQEKHVCGLQGFDGMKGDTCPACIAIKGEK